MSDRLTPKDETPFASIVYPRVLREMLTPVSLTPGHEPGCHCEACGKAWLEANFNSDNPPSLKPLSQRNPL